MKIIIHNYCYNLGISYIPMEWKWTCFTSKWPVIAQGTHMRESILLSEKVSPLQWIPHTSHNNAKRKPTVASLVLPLQTNSRFWTSATLWPLRWDGPIHCVYKPTRGRWRSQSESQARWQSQYRLFVWSRLNERKEFKARK